jgi:hypothetical protein
MTAIFECKHSVPFGRLILKNIIIFIFVGAIEYIFFTNIAMKYIPSPPTLLVKTLITALQKRFQ